ncbi:DUF397 domain-containing protein [Streptomyces sp. NPDC059063]|uniref:DUF397 domain-containing protein n=1 Tax=unclassified Streptomyces TaxID=2593676 RepID=UPI0036CD8259
MITYEWQKSSYCQSGDACVHVAETRTGTARNEVHLTESADPAGAILTAPPGAFAALLRALK